MDANRNTHQMYYRKYQIYLYRKLRPITRDILRNSEWHLTFWSDLSFLHTERFDASNQTDVKDSDRSDRTCNTCNIHMAKCGRFDARQRVATQRDATRSVWTGLKARPETKFWQVTSALICPFKSTERKPLQAASAHRNIDNRQLWQ